MQVWIKEKLFIKSIIRKELELIQKEIEPNFKVDIPKLIFNVKKFIVLGIPNQHDFRNIKIINNQRIIPRWERLLIDFQKENDGFIFVDGFEIDKSFFKKNENKTISDYIFLSCDGHWNEMGSKLYADLVESYL